MVEIILVVEDTPEQSKIAISILKERGFKVLLAESYQQARTVLSQVPVSAILTDLFFPEKKGQEPNACGISIAIEAKMKSIPVAICSQVNHHSCEWLWHAWKALQIPVSETKNWNDVTSQLLGDRKKE
ncbi:MAG TPA: hypothetical protein VJB58_01120 [Candidatus Paceibacterota bacterium]